MQTQRHPLPFRKPLRSGFSSVELMVVVGIIGALASLGVVSLRGVHSTSKLRTSGVLCANLLESARSIAISNKTPVAVAFLPPAEQGSANLALLEFKPDTRQWKQISKLESLAANIVVDPEFEVDHNSSLPKNAPTVAPSLPSIKRGSTDLAPGVEYGYLVFMPSGSLYQSNSAPGMIRLREGIIRADTVVDTSSSSNHFDLFVNPHTGRVKFTQP